MVNSANDKITPLIERSVELKRSLSGMLTQVVPEQSGKEVLSRTMCLLAREHSAGVVALVANGLGISALGLLRLQYEVLVRMFWVYFAASESALDKLAAELEVDTARQASNKMKMVAEMLTDLEGKAPQQALDQLLEFRDYSWKALNSYVHGGLHATYRQLNGMPIELVTTAVKQSNGLVMMSGMLMTIITQSQKYSGKLAKYQLAFSDVLPPMKGQA